MNGMTLPRAQQMTFNTAPNAVSRINEQPPLDKLDTCDGFDYLVCIICFMLAFVLKCLTIVLFVLVLRQRCNLCQYVH